MSNRLVVKDFAVHFKESVIFSHVSYTFESGKIYGITGENGCGKTVLMKCLCGLLPASEGTITLNDHYGMPPKGTFGVIIETPGFLPNFSGYTNLKMLASLQQRTTKQEVMACLDAVNLRADARKRVGTYSLGMRQRLGLAQAIINQPPILLLDEPFNALDQASLRKAYAIMEQMRSQGKIIILSSHHSMDIDYLCDEVLELRNGCLTQ